MLDFGVTLKVFTPCFGVLPKIWGTWSIISPFMVCDGFADGRWYVMDFHIGGGLINDLLTSVGCLLGIIPYLIGDLLTTWVMFSMMAT
jgi:hypothetical protein